MTQILFEKLRVPAMYVANESAMSLYASGRNSGVALDSGHGLTQIVPVYEGHTLPHAASKIDVAGSDITSYLGRSLRYDEDTLNDIKEKCCRVALDPDGEAGTEKRGYELPDGQYITLGDECFQAPEILLQPGRFLGINQPGIHELVIDAIQKCDSNIQDGLYSNILVVSQYLQHTKPTSFDREIS